MDAVLYSRPPGAPAWIATNASANLPPAMVGDRFVTGRWRVEQVWIAHCSAPTAPLIITLLIADKAGGLAVAWSDTLPFAAGQSGGEMIAADIAGDGDDELVFIGQAGDQLGHIGAGAIRIGTSGPTALTAPTTLNPDPITPRTLEAADIDKSGRKAILFLPGAFIISFRFDPVLGEFHRAIQDLSTHETAGNGSLLSWVTADTNLDGAVDLVRIGKKDAPQIVVQVFRAGKDGHCTAEPWTWFTLPTHVVGLLKGQLRRRNRAGGYYLIHYLYSNNGTVGGRLGWAALRPDEKGGRFEIAGRHDDMGIDVRGSLAVFAVSTPFYGESQGL